MRNLASGRYNWVIRGGLVATADWQGVADLGISGETVGAVTSPGLLDGDQEIDASGLIVVPGGVDPHVHSALASGGTTTVDDFADTTRAALHGGTTTIVDFGFPLSRAGELPREALVRRTRDANEQAWCDVALHASATTVTPQVLKDLEHVVAEGYPTLKVFTIYRDDFMLSLDEVRQCMEVMAATDGLVLVHAESPHLIEPLITRSIADGNVAPSMHARTRPPVSELDMIQSIISLAKETGCPVYIVHVSTPAGTRAILDARSSGVRIWAETCPQYIFLDDTHYSTESGPLYVCSPPLRSVELREEHLSLLEADAFTLWGSDHCGYTQAQKFEHCSNFTRIPNGLPGVETRCPLLFSLVLEGRLSLQQFVRLTSSNPARLNGLFPRKGTLAPGSDADMVLWDPGQTWRISSETLHQASDFSPYEGLEVRGAPRHVFLRGDLQIRHGALLPAATRNGMAVGGQRPALETPPWSAGTP